jgi:hypothetical protein
MMKTVKAMATASPTARKWYWPRVRNDSSGPYADELFGPRLRYVAGEGRIRGCGERVALQQPLHFLPR